MIGEDGAGGGGGFARTRLSAAIDTAILRCANSSVRTAIPDKKRETCLRGLATFSVRKRLGFGCRKREPLSVRDLAAAVARNGRPVEVNVTVGRVKVQVPVTFKQPPGANSTPAKDQS